MKKYDSHIHSTNSFDGKQTVDEICRSALSKGLTGVTVSDHADIWYYVSEKVFESITSSVKDVSEAAVRYDGRLKLFRGVEMSEYFYDTEKAERILDIADFDVVLGSVHCIEFENLREAYSRIDFGDAMTDEQIYAFLGKYLQEVSDILDKPFFDVLCHLTCPLRYINGKYNRGIDIMNFEKEITDILKKAMSRGIALEVNTSGIGTPFDSLMPDERILELYRSLGGEMITLGSDAHTSDRIGNAFDSTAELLKKIGFKGYLYYENRVGNYIPF